MIACALTRQSNEPAGADPSCDLIGCGPNLATNGLGSPGYLGVACINWTREQ